MLWDSLGQVPLDLRVTGNRALPGLQILIRAVGVQLYKEGATAAALGVAPSGPINQGSWIKASIPFIVWHL